MEEAIQKRTKDTGNNWDHWDHFRSKNPTVILVKWCSFHLVSIPNMQLSWVVAVYHERSLCEFKDLPFPPQAPVLLRWHRTSPLRSSAKVTAPSRNSRKTSKKRVPQVAINEDWTTEPPKTWEHMGTLWLMISKLAISKWFRWGSSGYWGAPPYSSMVPWPNRD